MRLTAAAFGAALGLGSLSASLPLLIGPAVAAAKPTAQTTHCAESATKEGLTGAQRTAFLKTCQKGSMHPTTPTGPTANSKEAQAVTKPSGVDRTTRAKQCAAEADKKGLASQERGAFQKSCLATAGPVSEGETGTKLPGPSHSINGIGENNYKPSAATAKSKPAPNAPEAIKPAK